MSAITAQAIRTATREASEQGPGPLWAPLVAQNAPQAQPHRPAPESPARGRWARLKAFLTVGL